ncbi:uncharacterized protein LOC144450076 [Glandiceps talaboti]
MEKIKVKQEHSEDNLPCSRQTKTLTCNMTKSLYCSNDELLVKDEEQRQDKVMVKQEDENNQGYYGEELNMDIKHDSTNVFHKKFQVMGETKSNVVTENNISSDTVKEDVQIKIEDGVIPDDHDIDTEQNYWKVTSEDFQYPVQTVNSKATKQLTVTTVEDPDYNKATKQVTTVEDPGSSIPKENPGNFPNDCQNSFPVCIQQVDFRAAVNPEDQHVARKYNYGSTDTTEGRIRDEKPFVCEECGKGFYYFCRLAAHKRMHTGDKPFVCQECGRGCNSPCSLKEHMRIHANERSFVCKECGKGFNRSSNLGTHMKVHTTDRPFVCKECGKDFKMKSNLNIHMKVHSDERPFVCKECGKSFSRRNTLNIHSKIHLSERPHICIECGAGFTYNGNLKVHMKIHTNERPYICAECGKGFNQRGDLKRHMKMHTN